MNDGYKNIMNDSGECLSEEQLKGYVQGILTPLETKQVELHLADCEFCNDAVDGLKQSDVVANFQVDVARINKRIDKKYKHKRSVIIYSPWRIISVAAGVVAIVLGTGIYFNLFVNTRLQAVADRLENLKDQIAFIGNKSFSKDTLTIITEKQTAVLSTTTGSDAFDNSPLAEIADPAKSDSASTGNAIAMVDENLSEDAKSLKFIPPAASSMDDGKKLGVAESGVAEKTVAAKENTEFDNVAVVEKVADKKKTLEKTTNSVSEKSKALETPDLCSNGIAFYKTRNFTASMNQFLGVLAKEPSNIKARYYLGMSYFYQDKFIDAIKQFDQIMLQSNDAFYEEARFQKALAHIQIDDALTARAIFQQIIAEGSPFKPQAEAYLKELK